MSRRSSVIATAVLALALAAFVTLFRLATLGGTLGGFDNDHFVHFSHAKQVQAGERPLRDFLGVGLQGVWPTLTYGASAAAQAVLGNNLWSEALLTAGALGIAAGITVVAGAGLAAPPWAAATTLLGALAAPKLYAYPKVLLLAVEALLIVAYARRPGWRVAAAFAALTAVAFLFRHDYAVYVAIGTLATLAAAAARGGRRAALRDGLVYAGLTVLLLAPSLALVQRDYGLDNYLADVVEESSREAARSEPVWPAYTPALPFTSEDNATAVLYWVLLALPVAALIAAARAWKGPDHVFPVAVAGLAAMMIAANALMLRGNLAARFGDVGSVGAVIGAALCAGAARPRWPSWRVARAAIVVAALGLTTATVWSVGSVAREIRTAGYPDWPAGLVRRVAEVSGELSALPQRVWAAEHVAGTTLLVQYLNRCTLDRDRVFVVSYAPELVGLSGRLYAGGVLALIVPPHTAENDRRISLLLQTQHVPVVLLDDEQRDYAGSPFFPRVQAYLDRAYAPAGAVRVSTDRRFHVLASRRRVPTGTFRDTGLPCFR